MENRNNCMVLIGLILLTLTIGCKKENEICEPANNLVGKWVCTEIFDQVEFTDGYEFIHPRYGGMWSEDLIREVKGEYCFSKGYIEIKNLRCTFIHNPGYHSGPYYEYLSYQFQILDSSWIMLEPVEIFIPIGHSGYVLSGKWQSKLATYYYHDKEYFSGTSTKEIIFNTTDSIYYINMIDSINNSVISNSYGPYSYRIKGQIIEFDIEPNPIYHTAYGIYASGTLVVYPYGGFVYGKWEF